VKLTFEEIIKATKAEILYKTEAQGEFSISTDTRKIQNGEIYLPLRGENFDGHNFIDKAIELKAAGYFTQDRRKVNKNANFVLYVKNTLLAYLELANFYRRKVNPKVIAITGSSGKTTVKEMMACVCGVKFKTHKSKLNHNNEIGLCETITSMPYDTQILVVEMGMRNLGEIELLSKYCEPNVAIISNVGTAHVGILGTVNNIARAKCEITAGLNAQGAAIVKDCPLIRENLNYTGCKKFIDTTNAKIVDMAQDETTFIHEGFEYTIFVSGEYNIENAVLVIEAAKTLGMKEDEIAQGLKKYRPIEKRWEVCEIKGLNIINDSYNSNPDSARAVIKAFSAVYKTPLTIVLGDMGELGKNEIKYHKELGEFLSGFKNLSLVTVGELAKYIAKSTSLDSVSFDNKEECAKHLLKNSKEGTTILFKASRKMEFEKIIEEMKK